MFAKYIKHARPRTESKRVSIAVSSQEIWQKVRNEALQILKHAANAWQVHAAECRARRPDRTLSPSTGEKQTARGHILALMQRIRAMQNEWPKN